MGDVVLDMQRSGTAGPGQANATRAADTMDAVYLRPGLRPTDAARVLIPVADPESQVQAGTLLGFEV
jgi:hypothetical protein